MIFEPGKKVDRFVIKRKLGEGGMGEVYLAEDTKLGRDVAIKLLRPEFFDNVDRLDRFRREAQTSAKISHSNVMSIYDFGSIRDKETDREIFYIVMEYVTGESLSDYLQTHSLDMAAKLRIAEKIAAGLAAAHKLNIVHRDIKTDNIKIDDDGEPRILDFGLAKPIVSAMGGPADDSTHTMSNDLTQEGKILGTITYMSPEQARGEQVDARSDIFSFGILVYRIFTGKFPFEAGDRVSTLAKILEGKHTPIRQLDGSLPYDLERIIEKCLQKNPNERYQDTRDLVVDIRAIRKQFDSGISDTTSMIADSSLSGDSKTFTFKVKWPIAVAALIFIIVGAFLIFGGSDDNGVEVDKLEKLEGISDRVNDALRKAGIDPKGLNLGGSHNLSHHKNALAILGFENKTGDEELDWLQAGLPEILLTDLSQIKSISLISRSRVLDCLSSEDKDGNDGPNHEACIKAAQSLGASKVLSGSFFKLGDKIRIDARLEDIETGEILSGEKVVGSDPFVLVDSLTQKVAMSLDMAVTDQIDVAQMTSTNPEAYRHYILGMQQFLINNEESEKHLLRAIELDSTFALANLRLGMLYTFQNKRQLASSYFHAAEKYSEKMPAREKSLVDIYSDIWLRFNLDDAMIKTRSYLSNYPDDKEMRGFYALMLGQLEGKFELALAQLDTVTMLDPDYYIAYLWYSDLYRRQGEIDKAIETAIIAKEMHPDAPEPYENLIGFYVRATRYDEAEAIARDLLNRYPNNATALSILSTIKLIKRDFDESRMYIELIKERHGDDPFRMISYYERLSNLSLWRGEFDKALDYMHDALETAVETGDSGRVSTGYSRLHVYYDLIDVPDSSLKYSRKTWEWSTRFEGLDYPIAIARYAPEREEEARKILDESIQDFKSRVPPDLWLVVDNIAKLFEGRLHADTLLLIEALEAINENQLEESAGNYATLGKILVGYGRYQEGKENLLNVVSGPVETTSARVYIPAAISLGIAEEELGNTQEAIKWYQEVMSYWGDADIEIKELKECRKRLNSLIG